MDTLFFWASKLVWALISPDSLLLLLWLAGVLLLMLGAVRYATRLLGFASILSIAVALFPLGDWLISPLEARFPPLERLPETVDGIIVLGGFVEPYRSHTWLQVQSNQAAERLWAFTTLARQYPEAVLVFSGGNGSLSGQTSGQTPLAEADFLPSLAQQAGLATRPLLLEAESRNTYENVINSKALVDPQPQQRWLMITSAAHMPRAVGIFCAQQWAVLPYPVDYRSDREQFWQIELNFAQHLQDLREASREWIGLLAYYVSGKTESFLADQSSACVRSSVARSAPLP